MHDVDSEFDFEDLEFDDEEDDENLLKPNLIINNN
jgi:hypothetical protein